MTAVHTTYCPHCRTVTNLSFVVIPCLTTDLDGKEEIVISRTYHCKACGLFVRSEENAMPEFSESFCPRVSK